MRKTAKITWNDEWILNNKGNYPSISSLYNAYTQTVDASVNKQAFRTHLRRKGIFSNQTWSEAEKEWLKDNFHMCGGKKSAELFYKEFGKCRSYKAITAEARRQGLLVDKDVVDANKNYPRRVPIGTIVDDGEGYLKIKTGNGNSGWERYHRYIYKKEHGEIPAGHKIIFLDGDRRNYSVENMVAVPSSYLAYMNKLKLKSNEQQITKTSVEWCRLYELLKNNNYESEENENE